MPPAATKPLQSCPTLCDPHRRRPTRLLRPWDSPGKSTGWVAISSPMHACMLSHFSRAQLCVTPWTAAHQVPLSLGFSRKEHWSGMPCPPPSVPPSLCNYTVCTFVWLPACLAKGFLLRRTCSRDRGGKHCGSVSICGVGAWLSPPLLLREERCFPFWLFQL